MSAHQPFGGEPLVGEDPIVVLLVGQLFAGKSSLCNEIMAPGQGTAGVGRGEYGGKTMDCTRYHGI